MIPHSEGRDVTKRLPGPITRPSGLSARSTIMTHDGEKWVAEIKPGDRIITRDSGMARVRSVRTRRVHTLTVCIGAGSLGHTRPDRDAILPAGQMILIRDWRAKALYGMDQALVPAARLVDGQFITLNARALMTLRELKFDRPHILYVDGLEIACHHPPVTERKAA